MTSSPRNVFLQGGNITEFSEPVLKLRRLSFRAPLGSPHKKAGARALAPVSCSAVVDKMPAAVGGAHDSKSLATRWSMTQTFIDQTEPKTVSSTGKFGRFGGKFVPETLISCLSKLEAEFILALHDKKFQVCPVLSMNACIQA